MDYLPKFKFPRYSLLPLKKENIVLNTFINATLKTFGFMISLQIVFYIYWKKKFPVGKGIQFMLYKNYFFLPFFYYWYRKLKLTIYSELDKIDTLVVYIEVPKDIPIPVEVVKIHREELRPILQQSVDTKVSVKDKLHLSYVLE